MYLREEQEKAIEVIVCSYSPRKQHGYPVSMKTCLTDDTLIFQGPRRMSYSDRCIVQIAEWMEQGIIQPGQVCITDRIGGGKKTVPNGVV